MLHEILLSLSGHPSSLFDVPQKTTHAAPNPLTLLSPPETELLSSIAVLSRTHRKTREHVARIAASHPSTICRAVATAITSYHLDKFQQKVLDVESRILKQDASAVGAYNIVPLAGIVGEFSEWTRLMEWLWNIGNFISESEGSWKADNIEKADPKTASGAELMNKLRTEAQTGYPDIEEAALYLGAVAETSWMRQLSSWLLYGRLPIMGASDFFISVDDEDDLSFVINHRLLPKFVTRQTATSMLFVGKSLNQIRSLSSSAKTLSNSPSNGLELNLLSKHVSHLSNVHAPISSAQLSAAVASIRLSLSQNLLQYLLPRGKIIETLTVLHQFFLLGRGEFAMALITEADEKMLSRHKASSRSKSGHGIQGILLKEGEINNALTRSWSVLSSLSGEDDHTDDVLDVATDIVHLSVQNSTSNRPGTPGRARESGMSLPILSNIDFSNLMFSVPTILTMDLRSPLDLFMTKADLEIYSSINAYLLAVRRAHLHLAQLWRQSTIRREHPPPPNYEYSNSSRGKTILAKRRKRTEARAREMRKVWATCAAGIFFLAESEAYFQGEVVQESFKHFLQWVAGPSDPTHRSLDSDRSDSPDDSAETVRPGSNSTRQHDPETLSLAHRHFLGSISYFLLLTDHIFTQVLRDFFAHVDELVAYVDRLQSIRQSLDLESDGGVEDFLTNHKQDEQDVTLQLDRSRRRLDSDLKSLISRLRDLDSERVGAGPGIKLTSGENSYEPLRVGGVDRLLMKLDWGGVEEETAAEDLI